jgi:DNA recombination protein RmuC
LIQKLVETDTVTKELKNSASDIKRSISEAQTSLTSLHAQATARLTLEEHTAESIRRLESIIAGTQSKGAAGENIDLLPKNWTEDKVNFYLMNI